ncbi:hypothetical protein QFZ40_000118 [Arthrobacter pascens]|uniref:hypothetical protein n=1 Tax=Arthrobacter pascens TaxID=1677 RepID=UPI00277EF9CA|nr:hypothetical protein [Arthrobacter pascens]MDQ0632209.1 hypothetical protein [Arthrobacter pascens]
MSDNAGSRNALTVDQLLREAELEADGVLRPALLELQALAAERPQPSAAVAALMVPATRRLEAVPSLPTAHQPDTAALPAPRHAAPAAGAAGDELAARRRAKRRITLTTLSVAVSLAAGGAVAVASDQGIRDSVNHAVTSFVSTVGGGQAKAPAKAPAPVTERPGSPSTVPAPTAPAVPAPAASETDSHGTKGPQKHPSPTPSGGVPLPELPVPESITPGAPGGGPLHGEGQPSLPVPETPQVPLPNHVP